MTDKMLCVYVMINDPCFRRFILGRSHNKSNSVCEVHLQDQLLMSNYRLIYIRMAFTRSIPAKSLIYDTPRVRIYFLLFTFSKERHSCALIFGPLDSVRFWSFF